MPLFAIVCTDKSGALPTRLDRRPAHLDYLNAQSGVKVAGALLDGAGDACGSLIIVEAVDEAAAEAFADGDPFRGAGVFESVVVRRWRLAIGEI